MSIDYKPIVKKYQPLIDLNNDFHKASEEILGKTTKIDNKYHQEILILFSRIATLFESIQILCSSLKSLEAGVLVRSLFEANAYLRYIYLGIKKSITEADRRADLYYYWQFIEDKKILNKIKNGENFNDRIKQKFLSKEKLIDENFEKSLKVAPELDDPKRRNWHGFNLLTLAKEIDKEYGGGDTEKWYHSSIMLFNMTVHNSSKSSYDNIQELDNKAVLRFGGNESQMFSVLLMSFFIYRNTLLRLNEVFNLDSERKIKAFDSKHKKAFKQVKETISQG